LAYPTELGFVEAERIADLHERADHYLSFALRRSGEVSADRIIREGVADTEIIAAAKEWKADLIVLGSHNRGRFARLLLGSTAESVLRGAPCPVLVVTHPPKSSNAQAIPTAELAAQ
jgi:nucleotide-binding universal stress UspA family protein